MGMDIGIYPIKSNDSVSSAHFSGDIYMGWCFKKFLSKNFNLISFDDDGIAVVVIEKERVKEVCKWLETERGNAWEYDDLLSGIEGFHQDIKILFSW